VSIAETLGSVGSRFSDPSDVLRLEALSVLPVTSGLSPEMVRLVLDGMCRDWTREVFLELLKREFGEAEALDEPGDSAGRPGLATHVGAGTVPGVTATSLIRSLLVKTPALVKPGLGDVVLPVLWARALQAMDPVLGDALAVVYWPGGDGASLAEACEASDQVVVYGSNETVATVQRGLRENQSLIAYPHRVGLCALGRAALSTEELDATSKAAALAVATFDQRGCVSPHVIYVEEGGAVTPMDFAAALARELTILERELPSGSRSPEEAIAFQQLKGTLELRAGANDGVEVFSEVGAPWAVVVEQDPRFRPSCLGRFVWVKPIEDLGRLPGLLQPIRPLLQTVALEAEQGRRDSMSIELRDLGASRITTLDEAPWPRAWWHHDGRGPLRVLLGLEE
jgi:acyl-CoA reductase LuxC